jgi:hypothetical protein
MPYSGDGLCRMREINCFLKRHESPNIAKEAKRNSNSLIGKRYITSTAETSGRPGN